MTKQPNCKNCQFEGGKHSQECSKYVEPDVDIRIENNDDSKFCEDAGRKNIVSPKKEHCKEWEESFDKICAEKRVVYTAIVPLFNFIRHLLQEEREEVIKMIEGIPIGKVYSDSLSYLIENVDSYKVYDVGQEDCKKRILQKLKTKLE